MARRIATNTLLPTPSRFLSVPSDGGTLQTPQRATISRHIGMPTRAGARKGTMTGEIRRASL